MFRKPTRKKDERTPPDHHPMIPILRKPIDELDEAVRSLRRRLEEVNPTQNKYWR